jgi:PadR family transcriptional regulator, regulatory protein AphA
MTSSASGRGPALSSTEYTLLGLIARAEGAGAVHGYDLQRHLAESSLSHVIRIESGMMYHYLKKLAGRELITAEVSTQSGRPARHLHSLTDAGRAALDAWVTAPVGTTREIRMEFLLKLWFARQDPGQASRLVEAQMRVIDQHVTSLEAQIAALDEADRFRADVLALRLGQNRAIRHWLASLEHDS